MVAHGRLGQKNGLGFYRYEISATGKPVKYPDPVAVVLLQEVQTAGPRSFSDAEIVERMMLPLIIESALCLEEGVVASAAELDMALLLGVGLPSYLGERSSTPTGSGWNGWSSCRSATPPSGRNIKLRRRCAPWRVNDGSITEAIMLARTIFTADHDEFRKNVRRFLEEECVPHHARWEEQQHVDRDIWRRAGELGFLCLTVPEEYGGMGGDRLFSTVLMEEQSYAGVTGPGFAVHSDIVANYILNFGTEEQKRAWLPKMASGEAIGAIAMTEPGTGSDLQAVKARAERDGDDYIINGNKIFITNGYLADIVVVVAKTGNTGSGSKDISLILVENGRAGFTKASPLKKVGMKAQDTCELFFENVRVPRSNLLGGVEGQGISAADEGAGLGTTHHRHPVDLGGAGRAQLDRRLHPLAQGVRQVGRGVSEHALQARRPESEDWRDSGVRRSLSRAGGAEVS